MTTASNGSAVGAATVIICSRDRPGLLVDTVRSVLDAATVPREIVVIDQSTQPNAEVAGLGDVRGCVVRYVHSVTAGVSRARNVALRAATSEVVVFLDDDMFVEPGWLDALLRAMPDGDAHAVATGRVLPGPPERPGAAVPAAAVVTRTTPEIWRGPQTTDVVPGANVAMYRDVVLGVGGYDERLGPGERFAAAEDNDLGHRLLTAGCVVRFVPESVVVHRAWREPGARLRVRWDYGRGKGALYVKHMSRTDSLMARRLRADVRARVSLIVRNLVRSPATSAVQSVYLAGVLAGALEWSARHGAWRRRRT